MIRKLIIRLVRSLEKTGLFERHETRAVEKLVRCKQVYNFVEL